MFHPIALNALLFDESDEYSQMTDIWSENSLNHRTNNNHQILQPCHSVCKVCEAKYGFDSKFQGFVTFCKGFVKFVKLNMFLILCFKVCIKFV